MLLKNLSIRFITTPVVESIGGYINANSSRKDRWTFFQPERVVDADELWLEFSRCETGKVKNFLEKYGEFDSTSSWNGDETGFFEWQRLLCELALQKGPITFDAFLQICKKHGPEKLARFRKQAIPLRVDLWGDPKDTTIYGSKERAFQKEVGALGFSAFIETRTVLETLIVKVKLEKVSATKYSRCARKDCKGVFLSRDPRQTYCSSYCGTADRKVRYRKAHSKAPGKKAVDQPSARKSKKRSMGNVSV